MRSSRSRRALLSLFAWGLAAWALAAPEGRARADAAGDAVRAACRADTAAPVRVEVPVPPLEARDGALFVGLGRTISLEGGAVELYAAPVDGDELLAPAPMATPQAAAVVRAQAGGKLVARLAFELAAGALVEAPCLAIAGGRIQRARYRALQLDLFDTSTEEGRARRRPVVTFRAPGAVDPARAIPRVLIGPVALQRRDEAGRAALDRAFVELEAAALQCYATGLQRRPDLGGRVVFTVDVDRGRATAGKVVIDALGDPAVVTCLRSGVEALRVAPGLRAAGASLPIALERR